MDETVCRFGFTFNIVTGNALDRIAAPIGADISEHLGAVGQQLHKEHTDTVENIVFGGEDVGFTGAVPVKG